ncbi:MAG: hypothetical protein AAGG75_27905 [Bacteroidota bacterium]
MNVLDSARVIIYRINKKGLEIFLVNNGDGSIDDWQIPTGTIKGEEAPQLNVNDRMIELEPLRQDNGQVRKAMAIECDWHEIPSVRAIIKEDVRIVKNQIKQHFPDLEQGTYFAVKEAFRKVMPEEYAYLKELKDILMDRNQAKYI